MSQIETPTSQTTEVPGATPTCCERVTTHIHGDRMPWRLFRRYTHEEWNRVVGWSSCIHLEGCNGSCPSGPKPGRSVTAGRVIEARYEGDLYDEYR